MVRKVKVKRPARSIVYNNQQIKAAAQIVLSSESQYASSFTAT